MSTSTTDFTLREVNLPKLYGAFEKKVNVGTTRWVKVRLAKNITMKDKVLARKGDIVWAYKTSGSKSYMVHSSWTPKQREDARKYMASPKYIVRIPSVRKKAVRPMWEGQLHSVHVQILQTEAQVAKK
jgi:hypothetical protein